MTLEPLRLASVPLLEATTEVAAVDGYRLVARDDLQWLAEKPVLERLRFKATASTRFVLGAPRRFGEIQESLELPVGFNPRTVAWARAFRAEPARRGATSTQLAQGVLQYIRTSGFSYTLAPGDYGRDGIDEFWLDRKEGFCEHFASAFVVVMRAAGVPARIVTGYQGTDLPAVDGYYIVRQSSAHAWAEFWQSGTGWVRADPTGAVAPDRIGRSYRLAPQPGFVAGTLDAMNPQLYAQLRSAWETVNNRWNQWVLNYSRGQQLDVLEADGLRRPDLGGPRPPPHRRLERAGARRRDLGLARSPSRRPVGAPARAHEAGAASARRGGGAARLRRAPWPRAFASASAPPASRSRPCSMRSRRAATAAPPRVAPTRA